MEGMSQAVNLKVRYEGHCVKRFKLDDVTFQSLREALNKHAPTGMVCEEASYTDSDGDVVQIGSQLEFEECLRLCPPGGALILLCKVSSPRDLSSKGLIEIEQGHYDVAVQTFTQAVSVCPDEAALQYSLACALALSGRGEEAVQALRHASLKTGPITCPEVADWEFGSDAPTEQSTSESEAEVPLLPEQMDKDMDQVMQELEVQQEAEPEEEREPEADREPEAQAPAEQVDPSAAMHPNILGGILSAFQGFMQGMSGRTPVSEADLDRLRRMGFTDEEAMKRALSRARGDLQRAVHRLLSEVVAVHQPEQPERPEQPEPSEQPEQPEPAEQPEPSEQPEPAEQPEPLPDAEEQNQQQPESQAEQPQPPEQPEVQAEREPEQNQPTAIDELRSMGFSDEQKMIWALMRARGDVQRAVHELLSSA